MAGGEQINSAMASGEQRPVMASGEQRPYAVRECPPGMRIRGSIPLRKKEKKEVRGRDAVMKFDPGADKLKPEAQPRARVTYFLTEFRKRVQFCTAEKENKLKDREAGGGKGRVDLDPYNAMKESAHFVNGTEVIVGKVPGVEVGDLFVYRSEMNLISLHKHAMKGIDYIQENKNRFHDDSGNAMSAAVSVVASGGYTENRDGSSDMQIGDGHTYEYSGQGGNQGVGVSGKASDQELEGANRALKNCMNLGLSVRLIRRYKSSSLLSLSRKIYRYDGLYAVTRCVRTRGDSGKKVLKFTLARDPGQLRLSLTSQQVSGEWNLVPLS